MEKITRQYGDLRIITLPNKDVSVFLGGDVLVRKADGILNVRVDYLKEHCNDKKTYDNYIDAIALVYLHSPVPENVCLVFEMIRNKIKQCLYETNKSFYEWLVTDCLELECYAECYGNADGRWVMTDA